MNRNQKIALGVGGGLVLFGTAVWLWRRSDAAAKSPMMQNGVGAAPQLPPATRDSCIECVDKHLGAALILLGETRDGYPHRLRAIGHLHEAEDESQAWPALHSAIRDARKNFQHANVLPDFAALEALSTQIRNG